VKSIQTCQSSSKVYKNANKLCWPHIDKVETENIWRDSRESRDDKGERNQV